MQSEVKRQGGDILIVDNGQSDWKVREYLCEWTEISHAFDIATGYFEIGSLLSLDGDWQKLDKIRILMGDEVTKRTRQAILEGLRRSVTRTLDASIEAEKETNDFLKGVPAIVEALRQGKIECRVYAKKKFHAKAYITHSKLNVVGSSALVGSSNFTLPGLTQNIELNVQLRREVEQLQEWFEEHWNESDDVTPEILNIIERHVREYLPFEVYARSLQAFFQSHEMTEEEWEQEHSVLYPVLDQYQKDGYRALMRNGREYGGAFLCDGVGLGKTFVGMMLIERLVEHERKRVALFVPKAARKPVWEKTLKRYLPKIGGAFSPLLIFNHTDLGRTGDIAADLENVKERADVIIVDEAHHFRNPGIKGEGARGPSRYRRMFDLCEGKTVFLLTATPINNRLIDLQHLIELFSRRKPDYFKALGIHSLPAHFRKMEKALDAYITQRRLGETGYETNLVESSDILVHDALFQELVVQRSRAYVKRSQASHGGSQTVFPERQPPQVAAYSVKKTYGKLLGMIEAAFAKKKPLFSLAMYDPTAFRRADADALDSLEEGRLRQVVALIRTQFLKRFESSAYAFEQSCRMLLGKLLVFVTKNSVTPSEKSRLERWKARHSAQMTAIRQDQIRLFDDQPSFETGIEEAESLDDLITDELLEDAEELSRDLYNVEEILAETYSDLDQVMMFLEELRKFQPKHDDKLRALIKLLTGDPVLKKHKALIFTEYQATARYLREQLEAAGITGVDKVDSSDKRDRGEVIRQFSPYYNESSSAKLAEEGLTETRILISTDVLSEGLNLQDATRLINYDLHWNPVRLMQRIGRVDRRLNPDIEKRILKDHKEQKSIRGTTAYWNFLPPDELDELLRLYSKVSHKTLRISKTFGIEGRQLLTPDDDYEALKEFNAQYEGTPSLIERMRLEFQRMTENDPDLPRRLEMLPGRVFTGKAHPTENARGVFFCYRLPIPPTRQSEESDWTEAVTRWYLYDLTRDTILESLADIFVSVQTPPETPRRCVIEQPTLSEIRRKVEKHIKNTHFRAVQAPVGVKPSLVAWMELN